MKYAYSIGVCMYSGKIIAKIEASSEELIQRHLSKNSTIREEESMIKKMGLVTLSIRV